MRAKLAMSVGDASWKCDGDMRFCAWKKLYDAVDQDTVPVASSS